MDEKIAHFMLKMSKFEFYLVNRDKTLAHTKEIRGLTVIVGINWSRLAQLLQTRFPFESFDFGHSPFCVFRETAPQYLVKLPDGRLKWDSDNICIDSWERLLSRSFAQLRNNIAHGNKAQMLAPFTYRRTEEFLKAGKSLIGFIAEHVFDDPSWDTPIMFR